MIVDASGAGTQRLRRYLVGTFLLSGILIVCLLVLGGCSHTHTYEGEGGQKDAHNHLKCAGYCDLTIKSRDIEVKGKVTVEPAESKNETE